MSEAGESAVDVCFYPVSKETHTFQALDKQNDSEGVDVAFPVNKNHLLWMVVAKRRMGKSTLLLNVITTVYQNHFTDIYFFSPSARSDKKWKPIVEKLEDRATFYDDCSAELLQQALDDMEKNIKKYKEEMEWWESLKNDEAYREMWGDKMPPKPLEPKHLVILDDCVGKFGNPNDSQHPLVKLCNNSYHVKTSIWVAVQRYMYLLPVMRQNLDMLTLFRIQNKKELQSIKDEMQAPQDTFLKALLQATGKPYHYLHMHWCDGGNPTFFQNTQKMEIPDENRIIPDDLRQILNEAGKEARRKQEQGDQEETKEEKKPKRRRKVEIKIVGEEDEEEVEEEREKAQAHQLLSKLAKPLNYNAVEDHVYEFAKNAYSRKRRL